MAAPKANPPVRGTQLLVEHMSGVFHRPSLIAIELAWRWLFGIPFLIICWQHVDLIFRAFPLDSSGVSSINLQNPWIGAVELARVCSFYKPHIAAVLVQLLPVTALAWVVISGLGRNFLLMHIAPRAAFRPVAMIALQAARLTLLGLTFWGWLRCMQWLSAAYITAGSEPDLVGFFIWSIFFALGFFTAFALISWAPSIAPILVLFEGRSAHSALRQSLHLGRTFTSKLVEINLVLGIAKLALLVVAMVLSAAPLPFSDELGAGAMHAVVIVSFGFYIIANDFFQVVRLKAFVEFWTIFRGLETNHLAT
jgi:hypothetical protein